jgi:two-component system, OmpR family, phosphate regulon sensor histidine kinase PhoR
MLKKIFSPDPFKTFYLVFAYILAFSMWWAYLLYEKNETAYKEKVELNQITFGQIHPGDDYSLSADYKMITAKYKRQKVMIETEGSAFIFLLSFGLLAVRRVFKREMQLVRQQHNFLLSVTHELKSPLSTVKLSLQTMAMRKLEPEKEEKLIANSLVDIDRLETLVDNILFAAKIERDEPGFSNDEINISDITHTVIERFAHNKKAIVIDSQIKTGVYLHADPIGYTSVVMNLVENAIKYSEASTGVVVTLTDSDGKIFLSVADNGIGIAENEKGRVFDKFYRVGNEDTRKTKGTGLGLYIVKRFVEIYKGEISVSDNKPAGSVFKISLPKV